jgi:hypothetical protein
MAAKSCPSYCVEILGREAPGEPILLTLYWHKLPKPLKEWWYSVKPQPHAIAPPNSDPADQESPSILPHASEESTPRF